jgi:hypothetical protein
MGGDELAFRSSFSHRGFDLLLRELLPPRLRRRQPGALARADLDHVRPAIEQRSNHRGNVLGPRQPFVEIAAELGKR